ncbi:MAG: hypothetical protein WCW40_02495 [Bacteroidota bacterium]
MKLQTINASERFDNTSFSNEVIDGKSVPLQTLFTCAACGEKVGFTKNHIEHRSRVSASNLSSHHQGVFDAHAKEHHIRTTGFLDWNCPRCTSPIRVYVEHWAGGRHGDSGVEIKYVVEPLQ